MKPDMRTWVEAAATKHLRDGLPLEQAPMFLVGRALVQLLWYWRYDLPAKWAPMVRDLDYTSVALRMKDIVPFEGINTFALQIRAALDGGDWPSIVALPDVIWDWIEHMTGLSLEEWESVPDAVRRLLDTKIECPKCGMVSDFRGMGELIDISDPFAFFSTSHFRFNCMRCNTPLVMDAHRVIRPRWLRKLKWSEAKSALITLALVALGVWMLVYLRGIFAG
ncbi:MAG: hypothetical protein ABFD54_10680 [Armatimonadota bacterium]|nr:hypothetical protein [bacterium]